MKRRSVLVVLLLALGLAGCGRSTVPAPPAPASPSDRAIASAFQSQATGVEVQGTGTVERVLTDDQEGSRHQRFIVRLASGQTLLIAHNIDIAPRLTPLAVGSTVEFRGEYAWNPEGGVIHWTHHDPSGQLRGGMAQERLDHGSVTGGPWRHEPGLGRGGERDRRGRCTKRQSGAHVTRARKTATDTIALRITVVDPPAGIGWALQLGRDELVTPTSSDQGAISFDFSVEVVEEGPGGGFRLRGPAVQGKPGGRFVYVCHGSYAGETGASSGGRAKVSLDGITRDLLDAARSARSSMLEARFAGTGRNGAPACASVPLLGAGWTVA